MPDYVTEFDKMGFVPGKHVKTIDEYLAESEKKFMFLQQIIHDPETVVKGNVRVERLAGPPLDFFVAKYDTIPLPAIVADKESFKKAIRNKRTGISGALGTILNTDKSDLPVVLLVDREDMDGVIAHESVHAFRNQWNTGWWSVRLRHDIEEIMAYTSKDSFEHSIDILPIWGAAYCAITPIESKPYLTVINMYIGYSFMGWPGLLIGFCLDSTVDAINTMPRVYNARNLLQKGEDEGINMNYIFLRANFEEFNLKQPLEEQIAGKEGIKWDVIRHSLDITKAHK